MCICRQTHIYGLSSFGSKVTVGLILIVCVDYVCCFVCMFADPSGIRRSQSSQTLLAAKDKRTRKADRSRHVSQRQQARNRYSILDRESEIDQQCTVGEHIIHIMHTLILT